MDFFSNALEEKSFLVAFLEKQMRMVICFGSALTSLWCKLMKILSFNALVQRDKSNWPRCLLWHGWLPALAYPGGRSPWAETAEDIAIRRLERAYVAYSADVLRAWDPSQHFRKGLPALRAPKYPNVWTDGSLVVGELAGTASAGAGVFAHVSGSCWFHRRWGDLELRCTLCS